MTEAEVEAGEAPSTVTGWSSRFARRLAVIGAAAVAVRWYLVLVARPTCGAEGDGGCFQIAGLALWYHEQARLLADGHGFAHPFQYLDTGDIIPSALHPPLYSGLLGLFSLVGVDTVTGHRLISGIIGALAVVAVGLLGRRLGGDRVGLVAAGLAAVYPALWINDGMLQPESLLALLTALVLLAAFGLDEDPSRQRAAVLGGLIGLATLTRPEMLLYAPLLLVPLLLRRSELAGRERFRRVLIGLGATLLVLAPWLVLNQVRFGQPSLTNSQGSVIAESSCASTYYGRFIGYQANCHPDFPLPIEFDDEVDRESELFDEAFPYVTDHLERVPLVAAARVGRIWELYAPRQNAFLNDWYEGRGHRASQAAVVAHFLALPFAVAGAVALRRRGVTLLPMLVPIVAVTVTAAATFGLTRYRVPADVVIVVLAALGLDLLLRQFRGDEEPLLASEDGHGG
ncbi:MAG TPA: glycosyltransferase family 39 protein [Acidimicrobiales bacterium]